jgi:hypothetical protein
LKKINKTRLWWIGATEKHRKLWRAPHNLYRERKQIPRRRMGHEWAPHSLQSGTVFGTTDETRRFLSRGRSNGTIANAVPHSRRTY